MMILRVSEQRQVTKPGRRSTPGPTLPIVRDGGRVVGVVGKSAEAPS